MTSPENSFQMGGWLTAWWGFVAGLCFIIPLLTHLAKDGWTGAYVDSVVAGTALTVLCSFRKASIEVRVANTKREDDWTSKD